MLSLSPCRTWWIKLKISTLSLERAPDHFVYLSSTCTHLRLSLFQNCTLWPSFYPSRQSFTLLYAKNFQVYVKKVNGFPLFFELYIMNMQLIIIIQRRFKYTKSIYKLLWKKNTGEEMINYFWGIQGMFYKEYIIQIFKDEQEFFRWEGCFGQRK